MAFDQPTKSRLQRFANDARGVLEEGFTRQLQKDFGTDMSHQKEMIKCLELYSSDTPKV